MTFDILKIDNIVKEFTDFIYEQKIFGFFVGTHLKQLNRLL